MNIGSADEMNIGSADEWIPKRKNEEKKKAEAIVAKMTKDENEWKKKCSEIPGVYAISTQPEFYEGGSQRGLHILIVIIGFVIFLILILSSRQLYKINKNAFERKITSFFLLMIILFVIIFPIIVILKASECIKERKNLKKTADSILKEQEDRLNYYKSAEGQKEVQSEVANSIFADFKKYKDHDCTNELMNKLDEPDLHASCTSNKCDFNNCYKVALRAAIRSTDSHCSDFINNGDENDKKGLLLHSMNECKVKFGVNDIMSWLSELGQS